MPELFRVHQFFPHDMHEKVTDWVDVETAIKTAHQLTQSVGARIGTTLRVIIIDMMDTTVFEWTHSDGLIWPPRGELPYVNQTQD